MVEPIDVNSSVGSSGFPHLGLFFFFNLGVLASLEDQVYRPLELDVGVINAHALEVFALGDYIQSGFGIVSQVASFTLLRKVGKLKTPLMLEPWTLYISIF